MKLFAKIRRALAGHGDTGDTLARLLLAAKEDEAFRKRVWFILQLPAAQRESLIHSAVHEMRLRGESEAACAAFATLAAEEGAATARRILEET